MQCCRDRKKRGETERLHVEIVEPRHKANLGSLEALQPIAQSSCHHLSSVPKKTQPDTVTDSPIARILLDHPLTGTDTDWYFHC